MKQTENNSDKAKFPLDKVFPNYLEDYINEYMEVMEFDVNDNDSTYVFTFR